MFTAGKPVSRRILVVRLGAMGDIIHTLPAVAFLKQSHPDSHLTWLVEPRWAPLLEGNPYVDRVVLLRRQSFAGLMETRRELRAVNYDFAVDFQGLLKSAMAASAAHPDRLFGFHQSQVRERAGRVVLLPQNAEPLRACSRPESGTGRGVRRQSNAAGQTPFPLPPGRPEGDLPSGDFVLASPLAGWGSKQWPIGHYRALAARLRHELGIPLVLDGPPGADFAAVEGAIPHHSSLSGLIYATRRATAIVGVDSGPLHLAAALGKPGVAIFGPTDPARNGPYGDSLRVLRTAAAATTYKRGAAIDPSMQNISPDEVFEVLRAVDRRAPPSRGKPGRMIPFPKPYADAVARLRVPSGFLIVIVFAWFSRPTPESMAIGIPLSLLGLALRAWAAGCLAKNQQLATGGPYAYTRNPLYIGTLLVAAGLAVASRSIGLAVLFAAVFLLVYLPVIQNEEQHLRKIFPEYAAYAERVPALIPRITSGPRKKLESFSRRALSEEPRISSRSGILGRDAVSLLENAGLRACTLRGKPERLAPFSF